MPPVRGPARKGYMYVRKKPINRRSNYASESHHIHCCISSMDRSIKRSQNPLFCNEFCTCIPVVGLIKYSAVTRRTHLVYFNLVRVRDLKIASEFIIVI